MPPQSPTENRRWVLARRPNGEPTPDDFRLERRPIHEPREGQMLLANQYVSLDPYVRGRMNEGPDGGGSMELGKVMIGRSVGRVIASRLPGYAAGDLVRADGGWQDYALSDGVGAYKVDPALKPTWPLGVLGIPGFTGWQGLTAIGRPKAGETLVVSAVTGGVGAVAAQTGRMKGLRVVGIAGGPDKCRFAVEELGLDACIDHKAPDLEAQLAAACPDGVDIYFENVGGKVLRAVLPLFNHSARIVLCGYISHYNAVGADAGPDGTGRLMNTLLMRKMTVQGYHIGDHFDRFGDFLSEVTPWVQSGDIRYREDIAEGLESAPSAFIGLLRGQNFGKMILQVATDG